VPPPPATIQRVERIGGEGLGDQLHAQRTGHRAGDTGDHPKPVGGRRGFAAGLLEGGQRPCRVKQLEVREDQDGDGAHGIK
jgi:hypothetical protein